MEFWPKLISNTYKFDNPETYGILTMSAVHMKFVATSGRPSSIESVGLNPKPNAPVTPVCKLFSKGERVLAPTLPPNTPRNPLMLFYCLKIKELWYYHIPRNHRQTAPAHELADW